MALNDTSAYNHMEDLDGCFHRVPADKVGDFYESVLHIKDIKLWMDKFNKAVDETFGQRVYFVGLQGSYARGEATENSDIDVVLILDELSNDDILTYNKMLDTLPYRELICGFISGKNELMNWEPSDLFQFYHDTVPIKGNLDDIKPLIDEVAIERAIKIGACNIYHGCVHNMLHDKSEEILKGLYKSASFVIQAIAYKKSGIYIKWMNDLPLYVSDEEGKLIDTFLALKKNVKVDFDKASEELFNWSKSVIDAYGGK